MSNPTLEDKCDHTIGYLHEFVQQSEVIETLSREAEGWNSHAKNINTINFFKEKKCDWEPSDFIDRRRSNMTAFSFCPDCGTKINWKEIKELLKAKDE